MIDFVEIEQLEADKRAIEAQAISLKQTAEQLERKNAEARSKGEALRRREITFLKTTGEQLKVKVMHLKKARKIGHSKIFICERQFKEKMTGLCQLES